MNSAVKRTNIIPSKSSIKPQIEKIITVKMKKKNLLRRVENSIETEIITSKIVK